MARLLSVLDPAARGIQDLRRLSGGASQETWSFRIDGGQGQRLILRRAPDAARSGGSGIGMAAEAAVIRRAVDAGVPAPRIVHELMPQDGIGTGFIMAQIEGEALPSRLLRDPCFAPARTKFANQAGSILAKIHQTDPAGLPIPTQSPQEVLADLAARHRAVGDARPVFSFALRWLAEHAPAPRPWTLVHGDFRMGNLMLGPEGLRGVLDWELAHIGDPAADMGWLCMESWRFGNDDPVGGLGRREDLFAGYEAAGGTPVDPAAVRWWEILSALRWGVIIEEMGAWVRHGTDTSVERHVIARRASETEAILLLDLLEGAA
ncbi:phosphotransferase family protein [Aliishimia ponticola]|uniref:Phosphotransferase family protein n=1 Tax=Aliishimia ponticola TaxID=2499833 RepID=A0A4S4NDC1_9RHOB|nr:phosphotransferase family protein [Aliishimia ponticola]